jgi:hypothetical protein
VGVEPTRPCGHHQWIPGWQSSLYCFSWCFVPDEVFAAETLRWLTICLRCNFPNEWHRRESNPLSPAPEACTPLRQSGCFIWGSGARDVGPANKSTFSRPSSPDPRPVCFVPDEVIAAESHRRLTICLRCDSLTNSTGGNRTHCYRLVMQAFHSRQSGCFVLCKKRPTRMLTRDLALSQLSYSPFGPVGLEPTTSRLRVDVLQSAVDLFFLVINCDEVDAAETFR